MLYYEKQIQKRGRVLAAALVPVYLFALLFFIAPFFSSRPYTAEPKSAFVFFAFFALSAVCAAIRLAIGREERFLLNLFLSITAVGAGLLSFVFSVAVCIIATYNVVL